jgi:hypothetical protein
MGVAVSPEVGATLTNVGAVVAHESTIPYVRAFMPLIFILVFGEYKVRED